MKYCWLFVAYVEGVIDEGTNKDSGIHLRSETLQNLITQLLHLTSSLHHRALTNTIPFAIKTATRLLSLQQGKWLTPKRLLKSYLIFVVINSSLFVFQITHSPLPSLSFSPHEMEVCTEWFLQRINSLKLNHDTSCYLDSFCSETTLYQDACEYCLYCAVTWNLSSEPHAAVKVVEWLTKLLQITNCHVENQDFFIRTCSTLQSILQKSPRLSLLTIYDPLTDCMLQVASFVKFTAGIKAIYGVLQAECSAILLDSDESYGSRYLEHMIQSIVNQLSVLTLYEYAT